VADRYARGVLPVTLLKPGPHQQHIVEAIENFVAYCFDVVAGVDEAYVVR